MRNCKGCGATKSLDEFPIYKTARKTGRRHTCRQCWNARWSPVIAVHNSRYYHENHSGIRDRVKARTRSRYRDNPLDQYECNRKYEACHPERSAAKNKVMVAVRAGRLKRRPCQVCSATPAQAHHDDYAKPLDVIWLCRTHHGERHRLLNRLTPTDDWPSHWPEDIRVGKRRAGAKLDGVEHREFPR
jgi:hypothetical protein